MLLRAKAGRSGGPVVDVTLTIWTIGHSTRSSDDFRRLLTLHRIELVADVRRFPGSRRLPQFGADALTADLARDGILYRWIPELGGRRRPNAASTNLAWRHSAFRAYADHVTTVSRLTPRSVKPLFLAI